MILVNTLRHPPATSCNDSYDTMIGVSILHSDVIQMRPITMIREYCDGCQVKSVTERTAAYKRTQTYNKWDRNRGHSSAFELIPFPTRNGNGVTGKLSYGNELFDAFIAELPSVRIIPSTQWGQVSIPHNGIVQRSLIIVKF